VISVLYVISWFCFSGC